MKVLVFGGDGFVGSHSVEALLAAGHEVAVFDRFPYGAPRNLRELAGRVRLLSGEFGNRDDVQRALEGQDAVFHFITASNPASSWNDPFLEVEQNLLPSLHMLEAAGRAGVRKVIIPSSGGTVYGRQSGRLTEDLPTRPFTPYGIGKLSLELFAAYGAERGGPRVDAYRIANAYGPRQAAVSAQGVLAVWMRAILRGEPVRVFGDNTVARDYVHVEDVAALMRTSLDRLDSSGVYNLGSGTQVGLLDLLERVRRVVGREFAVERQPRRPSDTDSVLLDSARLLALVPGFQFARMEEKLPAMWADFEERFRRGDLL